MIEGDEALCRNDKGVRDKPQHSHNSSYNSIDAKIGNAQRVKYQSGRVERQTDINDCFCVLGNGIYDDTLS